MFTPSMFGEHCSRMQGKTYCSQLNVQAASARRMHRTITAFAGDGNPTLLPYKVHLGEQISLQSSESVEAVQLLSVVGEVVRPHLILKVLSVRRSILLRKEERRSFPTLRGYSIVVWFEREWCPDRGLVLAECIQVVDKFYFWEWWLYARARCTCSCEGSWIISLE